MGSVCRREGEIWITGMSGRSDIELKTSSEATVWTSVETERRRIGLS